MTDNPTPKKKLDVWCTATLELLAAAAQEANELKTAKKPADGLEDLARSFDKLAARCRAQAVMTREQDGPQPINPMVQITVINVVSHLRTALHDLESNRATPKAWEDLGKVLAEEKKTTESMMRIMGQAGAACTVVLPGTPLEGQDGKPLVP